MARRTLMLNGRSFSLALEPPVWEALEDMASQEKCSIEDICADIDQRRSNETLPIAIRRHMIHYFKRADADATRKRGLSENNDDDLSTAMKTALASVEKI